MCGFSCDANCWACIRFTQQCDQILVKNGDYSTYVTQAVCTPEGLKHHHKASVEILNKSVDRDSGVEILDGGNYV